MTAIANAVIERVYEGPSGVSKVGPWQIYNFYVEGHEEKFTYFGGENKAIPRVGMLLEVLQYTSSQTEKDGKVYDNHTVKKLQTGQSATVTASPHQKGIGGPKTATEVHQATQKPAMIRKDTKSITIGMYACVKAAGSLPHDTVEGLMLQAREIFKSVASFAYTYDYRPDLDLIGTMMLDNEVPSEFWAWLCNANKVTDKMDLTAEATAYTLKEFPVVVKRYVDSKKPKPATIPQQDEDIHREQAAMEVAPEPGTDEGSWEDVISGPADTGYPDQGEEDHGTIVLTTGKEEMPPW